MCPPLGQEQGACQVLRCASERLPPTSGNAVPSIGSELPCGRAGDHETQLSHEFIGVARFAARPQPKRGLASGSDPRANFEGVSPVEGGVDGEAGGAQIEAPHVRGIPVVVDDQDSRRCERWHV